MLEINGQSILFTRGDTGRLVAVPVVSSTGENYVFVEGDRVIFRLRRTPDSGEVFEKDAVIDLENNRAAIRLDPEDTIDLQMTEYRYEFELVTALGEHYTFVANQSFTIGKELEDHGE